VISFYLQPGFKEISINAEEFVNRNIEHQYFIYKQGEKNDALKAFLAQRTDQRGILFCRTKTDAKRIAKQLAGFEVTAGALHGNLNQEMRDKVMRGFKKGRINLLVATDIAARGIDVKELDYIIHYHLPEKAEYYTHRSGRTARAGKSGISVCMIQSKDVGEITKLASELQIQFDEIKVEVEPQSHSKESIVVFVNLGFGQGFTRSNLAEFLVEEAGMNASDVKNVVVEDHHSSFEIPERYEKQLFINLKGYKIAHRNVKLTLG
jgi:ATP-dependent RNA helicase DeaD